MFRVANRKTIRMISLRTLLAKKGKNFIAVVAVALTSILFTSLFTVGGSIIKTQEQYTMRQVGGSSHAGLKYLTQEEYDILAKDTEIRDLNYRIIVSRPNNEELRKINTEINYYNELAAKKGFVYPTTGKMPEEELEIATSTIVLDALSIPHKLGEKVTLEFTLFGEVIRETFTLCGFWEGDPVMGAQQVMVSKIYCDKMAPRPKITQSEAAWDENFYTGRINADFDFKRNVNVEDQIAELCTRCGFDPERMAYGVNWAYTGGSLDVTTAIFIVLILLLILLSGYLIIYNIFYINVFGDIRFYGLLKTIGTTGKQLRRIVRNQAFAIALIGIPLGLILGWSVGRVLTPFSVGVLSVAQSGAKTYVAANPYIFAGAALFSFLTVYISCLKPCKIAGRVSPIEAIGYQEGMEGKRKKEKKTRDVMVRNMAYENVTRNKKKFFVVVLSLSLSLILLNSVYTAVTGFDMNKYLSFFSVSDFSVTDATINSPGVIEKQYDAITDKFLAELEAQGITEVGLIYISSNIWHKMSDNAFDNVEKNIFQGEEFRKFFSHPMYEDSLKVYRNEQSVDGKIFGINDLALSKLLMIEGEIDQEKWNTGNYVIVNGFGYDDDSNQKGVNFYQIGDKVTIEYENGSKKEYEVMAIGDIPYSMGPQIGGLLDCKFILPEAEYLGQYPEKIPMRAIYNVEEDKIEEMEIWISNYCENVETNLDYVSRDSLKEEFQGVKSTYSVVGGALSFILALIGILNFVNAMITSILARRQELAMLEAVGMTGSQLKGMLRWEGLYYGMVTIFTSLTLGTLAGYGIVQVIAGEMWFFDWHFTVLPIVLCIPVLLLTVIVTPDLCCKNLKKNSVVERIRIGE